MIRNLSQLQGRKFDVLVVGGGIYGVCTAWDAALRGLSVALVEKGDFGSATSSNSLKIIHGGLRYLQHADFKRVRESTAERRTLMRIAPHLVHPMPCLMPTYGHALKGKEVMAVALLLNDLVCFDRNGLSDPQKHIPRGRVISKKECMALIPGINEQALSGGALWYDCQLYNSERMLISILRSASNEGAVVANYVEMLRFVKSGNRVLGVVAKDNLTGDKLEIQAQVVVNNCGPWAGEVMKLVNGRSRQPKVKLSAAMNLVLNRQIFPKHAVGIWSTSTFKDSDALVSKGSRLFFISPWRNRSLIGTTHVSYDGPPGEFRIREQDIQDFIEDVNEAYPPAKIKREDVSFFYGGLLPADDVEDKTGDVRLRKSYQIIDHAAENGIEGLVSVIGVKYTTARDVAQRTVDHLSRKLNRSLPKCATDCTPIFGGHIDRFELFLADEKSKAKPGLGENIIEHLVYNYGSEYERVLGYVKDEAGWMEPVVGSSDVLKSEVIHAVREEMAQKLSDVVRRRTELGSAEMPAEDTLNCCAGLMAEELGWTDQKVQQEIAETRAIYQPA